MAPGRVWPPLEPPLCLFPLRRSSETGPLPRAASTAKWQVYCCFKFCLQAQPTLSCNHDAVLKHPRRGFEPATELHQYFKNWGRYCVTGLRFRSGAAHRSTEHSLAYYPLGHVLIEVLASSPCPIFVCRLDHLPSPGPSGCICSFQIARLCQS
jgi:hypothetical protein